ncbi:MAG: antibiotic biosynthesis monooxygenase [Vulcanimicrobiaceae bacterium]
MSAANLRTVLAFFELDATPHRGLPSELAERLGTLTDVAGFVEGALYVRPDHDAIAIEVVFEGEDPWLEGHAPLNLIEGANWRSRSSDVRTYRLGARVEGTESPGDESVFITQRFVVRPEMTDRLVEAFQNYAEAFMVDITGFQGADVFVSDDGRRVAVLMPWAYEAALTALEAKAGSLASMGDMFGLADGHVYESFERISHMLPPHAVASYRAKRA